MLDDLTYSLGCLVVLVITNNSSDEFPESAPSVLLYQEYDSESHDDDPPPEDLEYKRVQPFNVTLTLDPPLHYLQRTHTAIQNDPNV